MALTRGEKKLLALCALAICLPLGAAAFISHINATPIVATAPIRKAPQPNGYDLYVQASNAIKEANPPVDAVLEIRTIEDPKVRAQRYSLARKDAWLRQNKVGFDLFKKAQKVESLASPVHQLGPNSPSSAVRQMARYKVVESNAHWQRGDHHRALQSGLDILQLSYDIQRGGGIWDSVDSASLNQNKRITTGDAIEHLSAQQAKSAARRVENLLENRWGMEQVLSEDKHRHKKAWLKAFQNPEWRERGLSYRKAFGESLTWKDHWRALTISKRQIFADFDALYEYAVHRARPPYKSKWMKPVIPNDPFVAATQQLLETIHFYEAITLTADRVLMLRLALRAHQLEHGAPPPNLQTLVPTYLKTVPVDPFGKGEPMRYRTDGKTYTLWSIGPDGHDDGGTPIGWSKQTPKSYVGEREILPPILQTLQDARGDYVAGKNH